MDATQKKTLRDFVWMVAELHIGCARLPYFDITPTAQSAKLSEIQSATTHLLRLLKSFDHQVGQPLEEHSFDAPLVQELQMSSHVLTILEKSVSPNNPDDYPVGVIRTLEHFEHVVKRANEQIKPKRGNATNRAAASTSKSIIAKNLVFRHRAISGEFPATTSDGWAAGLLNEVFEHYGLGEDVGAYWLRRETAVQKKAIS